MFDDGLSYSSCSRRLRAFRSASIGAGSRRSVRFSPYLRRSEGRSASRRSEELSLSFVQRRKMFQAAEPSNDHAEEADNLAISNPTVRPGDIIAATQDCWNLSGGTNNNPVICGRPWVSVRDSRHWPWSSQWEHMRNEQNALTDSKQSLSWIS